MTKKSCKVTRGRSAVTGRFTTVAKARRASSTHVVTRISTGKRCTPKKK